MMKRLILILLVSVNAVQAQRINYCADSKQHSHARHQYLQARAAQAGSQISHEMKYDVKFVHLNLNLERNTKFISGNVITVATVTSTALDTFMCVLHQNFTVDSVKVNNTLYSYVRQDSTLKCGLNTALLNGATFTAQVFYKGTSPVGGGAIGSGYSTGTSNSWGNQATWSLSESFVAYHWWPCKQSLTDKIDSSWVYVTTDSLNKVGSNGLLKNVVIVGNKKRYEWKSRTPIDYYLISVAVAKYKEYKQYAKPQYLLNDSIFIQNYIYDNAINNPQFISGQKIDLDKMPQVLNFLCNMYGMYPFYKEKYGHCMAPFGGGMEHQTMTSLGFFEYYIDAHELGHQWWGDQVTCKTWGDIWINEGFASYTEHLVAEYLDPSNFAGNLNAAHASVMQQIGGSVYFTNADTMDSGRIFDSRLTYDKGGAIIHSLRFLTNNDSTWFNALRGFQTTFKNSTASAVDFQNYYQTFTGINPTVFFNQWYYGEGYPSFNVKFHQRNNNTFYLKSTQSTSMPSSIPLFVTPIEYGIKRLGKPDTIVRVLHGQAVENYTMAITGTVTGVTCDPNNWLINKSTIARDTALGYVAPVVNTNPASLLELQHWAGISVGPNPVKQILQVNNVGGLKGTVLIRDVTGKIFAQVNLSNNTEINFENFADGIYTVTVYDQQNSERWTQKVLKE